VSDDLSSGVRDEPGWWQLSLTSLACAALAGLILLPLATVVAEAFRPGLAAVLSAWSEPETWSAIRLSVVVAMVVVFVNTMGGLAAAWLVARFRFRGRAILVTLIEMPLSVSPVIAGLVWMLLFGAQGWFGPWLRAHDIEVVFATPGLVLATAFVTFPYVARQVLPLMRFQGSDEDEAAVTLGAGLFSLLRLVTLPNIRWALLQGILLCNARALGEFGAVSVVSGHIRGRTETIPLRVEALYNDFQGSAAFAVALLLAGLALLTLAVRLALDVRFDARGASEL